MQFRVNDGQQIPQGGPDPTTGEYVRRILRGGDIVEGPPWWIDEFQGRMTPLDDAGNPVDHRALAALNVDLATAKAHERVGLLEDMIQRNPGAVGEALKSELAKAQADVETAVAEMEARRAARGGPTAQQGQPQRLKPAAPIIAAEKT